MVYTKRAARNCPDCVAGREVAEQFAAIVINACACADNTIRLWDPVRLREVAELRGHDAYVHAVDFSSDGTRLISASGDFTVRVWDTLSAQDRASEPRTK